MSILGWLQRDDDKFDRMLREIIETAAKHHRITLDVPQAIRRVKAVVPNYEAARKLAVEQGQTMPYVVVTAVKNAMRDQLGEVVPA